MPAQIKITLSAEEKKQLEKNIKSRKTPVRLLERSKIVLLAAVNIPNYKIAEELGIDVNKVGRWRNRFAERRPQGIEKELPRGANHGGKNSEEQAKLRSIIIKMTTQEKPKDSSHWSTRGLAKVLGVNHSFVNAAQPTPTKTASITCTRNVVTNGRRTRPPVKTTMRWWLKTATATCWPTATTTSIVRSMALGPCH